MGELLAGSREQTTQGLTVQSDLHTEGAAFVRRSYCLWGRCDLLT